MPIHQMKTNVESIHHSVPEFEGPRRSEIMPIQHMDTRHIVDLLSADFPLEGGDADSVDKVDSF